MLPPTKISAYWPCCIKHASTVQGALTGIQPAGTNDAELMIAPSTPAEMSADVVKLHLSSEKEDAGFSSDKQLAATATAVAALRISATAGAAAALGREDPTPFAESRLSAGWHNHPSAHQSFHQIQPGITKPMVLALRPPCNREIRIHPSSFQIEISSRRKRAARPDSMISSFTGLRFVYFGRALLPSACRVTA
jgi:hypothetical protein